MLLITQIFIIMSTLAIIGVLISFYEEQFKELED